MATDKVRLSLEVTTELNRTLEELATQVGGTKSDAIRKAIALLSVAIEGKQQGQSMGLVDRDNKLVTRIVGV